MVVISIRNLVSLGLFYLFVISSGISSEPRLMGIEVETSAVKVEGHSTSRVDLTVCYVDSSSLAEKSFILEEDTSDAYFKGTSHESHDRNLEFKTVRGFTKPEIILVGDYIGNIISSLYTSGLSDSFEIKKEFFESTMTGATIKSVTVDPANSVFSVKTKASNNVILRPQLTFQLPFGDITRVFHRLATLGHKNISQFLNAFDSNFQEAPIVLKVEKFPHFERMRKASRQRYEIRDLIRTNLSSMPNDVLTNGFCILFLYYWHELFDGNTFPESSEPGIKQYLAIMSRVPFSELYHSLEPTNQVLATTFLTKLINLRGTDKLKAYYNYESPKSIVNQNLTIKDWYESIITQNKGVDALSPPPALSHDSDSMGSLKMNKHSNGFPLIEARGYASISEDERSMSKIAALVRKEAEWFFVTN